MKLRPWHLLLTPLVALVVIIVTGYVRNPEPDEGHGGNNGGGLDGVREPRDPKAPPPTMAMERTKG